MAETKIISVRVKLNDLKRILADSKSERRSLSSYIINVVLNHINSKKIEEKENAGR